MCLVTGGLGGIAMGVTKLILKRGGKVFLCDLRPEEEGLAVARKELNNDSVCYAKCDVTNEKEFDGEMDTMVVQGRVLFPLHLCRP